MRALMLISWCRDTPTIGKRLEQPARPLGGPATIFGPVASHPGVVQAGNVRRRKEDGWWCGVRLRANGVPGGAKPPGLFSLGLVRLPPLGQSPSDAEVNGVPQPVEVMSKPKKRLIVVGDRLLIQPEEGEDRTKVGLYLPASAVDNQAVQGGKVIATGPGNVVSAPTELDQEPWKIGAVEAKYVPLQARIGDYAIFFRRAAVEITFEGTRYLVVPQAAVLTLVREEDDEDY